MHPRTIKLREVELQLVGMGIETLLTFSLLAKSNFVPLLLVVDKLHEVIATAERAQLLRVSAAEGVPVSESPPFRVTNDRRNNL